MCPLNRHKMGIVALAIICLIHGTAIALAEVKEPVTDLDQQIPEFLFQCLTNPWIFPCEQFRKYLMIFDSQGNYFQEKTDKTDNSKYLSSSFKKKARKPKVKEMIEGSGYPNYLFQLETAYQNPESFFIATKSGQLLVAGSEVHPSLLLREDHCGRKKDRKLIVSSSASTTETPVNITSTTAVSTETPVISTTEASTTAIAISTPAPNMDYGCDQAQWKLSKVDGRFLVIESVSKPGFFLNVDSGTHMVGLGVEEEKLTGLKTSFLSHVTLDRSAREGGEPGIGDDAYGDVIIHYLTRNGSLQSGYVCDFDWGQETASSVCKYLRFETGIPTYDGRYSSTSTPEYVVSGLKCDNENLNQCSFRTVCGSNTRSYLCQNSMKAFGGTGYACNRGSATDVAGVVCGNEAQIQNVIKENVTCNRASLDKDRKSVAAMFSIQKQIKTTSSTMFENKHWSEYLLPMPMAISLMSALLLVSSQNDREIELVKPDQGHWDHLKYNYLQPNLLFLSHNVKENFLLSTANMGYIKVKSRTIHKNMKHALKNAFSPETYNFETLLPRNLKNIAQDAKINKEKAEEVHTAFNNTNQIIDELLQGLKNTQGFQQNRKEDAKKALEILNSDYEKNQRKFEENLKKKEEFDVKVNRSRTAFFDAANEAMNAQCVNEVQECNNCMWMEATLTDRCKEGKIKEICLEWYDPICLEKEKVCTGGYSRKRRRKRSICLFNCQAAPPPPPKPTCDKYEMLCKKHKPDAKCKTLSTICLEMVYEPAASGNYCQDKGNGTFGLKCTRCKWIDKVAKNLENVADLTLKMQHSVLNDESSYSGVAGVIEDLVSQVSTIDQDVQNYKKWKSAPQIALPIDNAIQAMNNVVNATRTMNNLVSNNSIDIHEKLKLEATRNINSTLKVTDRLVDMHIDLLSQMKIPIAIKSRRFALEVKSLLQILIARKVGTVGEMTEEDKNAVTTLLSDGKAILEEANKLFKRYEVPIKAKSSPGGAADVKTGELAQAHLEYLTERHKTEKVIESLANRMSDGIRDMFKQDLETQDINSVITKLVECSRYLNFLSEQWVELRIFFKKLSHFLDIMHLRIERMSVTYLDLGVNIPRSKLTKTFKDDLQRQIVDALSNNIYVGRIANYYTKIAEDGLLQRMASIGNYLGKVKDPVVFERLKKFIEVESIMTQEKIKAEVAKQEAKMNDAIMKDVSSIKNDLACKLKDAANLSNETVNALKIVKEELNKLQGVVNTTSNASPTKIREMNLFKGVNVELEKELKNIPSVDIGFEEEEEDYDEFD